MHTIPCRCRVPESVTLPFVQRDEKGNSHILPRLRVGAQCLSDSGHWQRHLGLRPQFCQCQGIRRRPHLAAIFCQFTPVTCQFRAPKRQFRRDAITHVTLCLPATYSTTNDFLSFAFVLAAGGCPATTGKSVRLTGSGPLQACMRLCVTVVVTHAALTTNTAHRDAGTSAGRVESRQAPARPRPSGSAGHIAGIPRRCQKIGQRGRSSDNFLPWFRQNRLQTNSFPQTRRHYALSYTKCIVKCNRIYLVECIIGRMHYRLIYLAN